MATLFTRPSMTKGSQVTCTLTRQGLLDIPMVSEDAYFSNPIRWKHISVHWEGIGAGNSQNKTLTFDGRVDSDERILKISAKARSNFICEVIVVTDFDQGRLSIPRTEIPQALLDELDISYAP